MIDEKFYIDIACKQQNCKREKVCGDTFLYRRASGGTRSIIVLSDGMGHGVKASILSNITASMIVNFNYEKLNVEHLARTILKSLPVCNVRKVSYSTFSIVDIDLVGGVATIIEYDNPKRLIFSGAKRLLTIDEVFAVKSAIRNQVISSTRFKISEGDRIVLMSDGVSQSGMGTKYRFGWGRDTVESYVKQMIEKEPYISSEEVARRVVWESICNDGGVTNDDVSCAVITIRKPKCVLLCTAIPTGDVDEEYIAMLNNFVGTKIICGYLLATMISQKTGKTIEKTNVSKDPNIQPDWNMEGIDIVSESLVTLSIVHDLLENGEAYKEREGIAFEIVEALLENDIINIVIGRQRNKGWVYKIDDYDLRLNIMLHIIESLEKKYSKEVNVTYI